MKPGMITSEKAKSIYKWILVIALAWLFSQLDVYPQATLTDARWTYAVDNTSLVGDNLAGHQALWYFPGECDTIFINGNATFSGSSLAEHWRTTTDTISPYTPTINLQASFSHNFMQYWWREPDTLYRFSKRSVTSTHLFGKYDGSTYTALTAPSTGTKVGYSFEQNDTFFMPISNYFAATKWGNSWNNTYQIVPSYSGYPVDNFKFPGEEDVYFVHSPYHLAYTGAPSSTGFDSSFIAKRESTTGEYSLLKMIDDSLGYRGSITGYINGSGQHVLYVMAQHPIRLGARIYQYIVETNTLTQIGDAATITGLSTADVIVNELTSSATGNLWMSAGKKVGSDTSSSRIYYYSPSTGSWFKMQQHASVTPFNNVLGYAPYNILAIGDSCFVFWSEQSLTSIDSTLSDQVGSTEAYAWISLTVSLTVTDPNGGELYTSGVDTATITWTSSGLDSFYISYSRDGGSTWILIDSTSESSYDWAVPNIFTTQARVKIADVYGSTEDASDNSFSILPTGAAINIIEPDGSNFTLTGNQLKILVESYLTDTLAFYFSIDGGSNYNLVSNSIPVGSGDGNPPDTTTYWWTPEIALTQEIYYKVTTAGDSNLVTGNPVPGQPYYSADTLENVGQRGRQQLAQGKYWWSNFFEQNDILYTVGYFAFVWGWYDYSDAYYCFYWNDLTNSWGYTGTGSSGEAFYPGSKVYHKDSPGYPYMVYYNQDVSNPRHKDAAWTATKPPTLSSPLTTYVESLASAGIDVSTYPYENDSTDADGWRYYLNGNTIWAKDVTNLEANIDFYLLDISEVLYLDGDRINIIAHDSLLFISNSDHKGQLVPYGVGLGSVPYEIVYTAPLLSAPYSYAYDITSTASVPGQSRKFFRGIYPEAILEMTSGK